MADEPDWVPGRFWVPIASVEMDWNALSRYWADLGREIVEVESPNGRVLKFAKEKV